MTGVETILAEVRRLGAAIIRDGTGLLIRPASIVPAELKAAIRRRKPEILLALAPAEIRWRAQAMLAQVPPSGPIVGLLSAREGAWPADDAHCVRCGDELDESMPGSSAFGAALSCEACREGALVAIAITRATR